MTEKRTKEDIKSIISHYKKERDENTRELGQLRQAGRKGKGRYNRVIRDRAFNNRKLANYRRQLKRRGKG